MSTNTTRTLALGACAIIFAFATTACGDDDTPVAQSGALTTTTMDDMGDMAGMDGEGDHESFAFGEPADPSDADRTIEVLASDSFTYDPPSITVEAGETVLFRVTNEGKVVHEFVLGDHQLQLDHEEEMANMAPGMVMGDEPNAVAIEPGQTKELAFTFTEPGELTYACHQPGHYDAGMIGDLTVE